MQRHVGDGRQLVAATTVRELRCSVGGCAGPEAGSAIAHSNNSPVVLNCIIVLPGSADIQRPYVTCASERLARRDRSLPDQLSEAAVLMPR